MQQQEEEEVKRRKRERERRIKVVGGEGRKEGSNESAEEWGEGRSNIAA